MFETFFRNGRVGFELVPEHSGKEPNDISV
jgi:hypothetical protein